MAWSRKRWQAIIWTNADPIQWRIYSTLGGDELTDWGLYKMVKMPQMTFSNAFSWMILFCNELYLTDVPTILKGFTFITFEYMMEHIYAIRTRKGWISSHMTELLHTFPLILVVLYWFSETRVHFVSFLTIKMIKEFIFFFWITRTNASHVVNIMAAVSFCCQNIISHSIGIVLPEYSGFSIRRINR